MAIIFYNIAENKGEDLIRGINAQITQGYRMILPDPTQDEVDNSFATNCHQLSLET